MPKAEHLTSSEIQEPGKRYFKMIDPNTFNSIGRYTGSTPKQAGSKAFSKSIRKIKQEGGKIPKTSLLYLRESTQNSLKKIYAYSATRDKLSNPQKVRRTNITTGDKKTVMYQYRNKLKKSTVPDQLAGHFKKVKKETSGGSKKKVKKLKNDEEVVKKNKTKGGSKKSSTKK